MKLKLPHLLTFLFTIVLMACSPEESNSSADDPINEFIFNGENYDLISVIIYDENTVTSDPSDIRISLFNKTSSVITSNADVDDVTYVYFEVNATNIEATTYNDIEDYNVSINNSVINSEFITGSTLLSNNDTESDVFAQSGSLTITNFSQFNIDFTFMFTRNDGQIISGRYNGNYLAPNSSD